MLLSYPLLLPLSALLASAPLAAGLPSAPVPVSARQADLQSAARADAAARGLSDTLKNQLEWSRRADAGVPEGGWSYNTSACGGYNLTSVTTTASGIKAELSLIGEPCNAFGIDYERLVVDVEHQSKERLRVHIYDADNAEFIIPASVFSPPGIDDGFNASASDLVFNHDPSPFAFWITRAGSNLAPIFDTRPASKQAVPDPISSPGYGGVEKTNGSSSAVANEAGALVFEAGYLELSSAVPVGANIYGLSESVSSSGFRRNSSATVQSLWARDAGNPVDQNEYGTFPVHMETRMGANGSSSTSHGVFLSSSQGMDIVLRDGVIEYRVLGGSLDFYFVAGPTPNAVIEQLSGAYGKPALPPYWAFGFHQCRWGYDNITESRAMVDQMRAANIPLEVAWNDIDWMDTYRNFIVAPGRFDTSEFTRYVEDLHASHQHYIPIIDGAMSVVNPNGTDVYAPYSRGAEMDVFMRNPDGSEYRGQVWPGVTVFPDWFQGSTDAWWAEAFANLSQTVDYDGIWLDMNEPSSFCDGSCGSGRTDLENITTPFLLPGSPGNVVILDGEFPEGYNASLWGTSGNMTINGTSTFNSAPPAAALDRRHQLSRRVGAGVDVNEPAYQIHNALGRLSASTVSPNATHANGTIQHFSVHNLWGLMSEFATAKALAANRPGIRHFLVARATAPSAGTVSAHWLGDNYSKWEFMHYSIQGILQFQIFQIPMVGADICGFNGNTDEELCNRWMSLGAFSPFARNHNTRTALSQEPYRWDSVADASRKALSARYALLPYWYSLFWQASISGSPPVRALFFEFPDDANLLANDRQFLVGPSVLVSPVLEPNATSVEGALPGGDDVIWRDWYDHSVLTPTNGTFTFPAPLSHIPVAIRSSSILLLHDVPSYTTFETRQQPFSLLVSLAANGTASGLGYVDDGETVASAIKLVHFSAVDSKVSAWTEGDFVVDQPLEKVTVLGVAARPETVVFNGAPHGNWSYVDATAELVVGGLAADLNAGWELTW